MKRSAPYCHCNCSRNGLRAVTICVVFATCCASMANAQTIDDAYRNELSRLMAEKTAINEALKTEKLRGDRTRAALVTEIEALSATLTELRAENNSQEKNLPNTTRLDSLEAQQRSLDQRARQIETWLETHGVSLPTDHGMENEHGVHKHPPLDVMMRLALRHVEEHGQLWMRSEQEYFGADGIAKKGPVLRIAEVGAVVVEPSYQPLTLATDGSLRVSEPTRKPSSVHGETRLVEAVLFDPDDVRVTTPKGSSWQDWMKQGGTIMWVIGALGILAILVFVERLLAYARFLLRLSAAERKGPDVNVSVGDRLLSAVSAIQRNEGTSEELETKAAEAILQTQPLLRRGVSLLAVVASVAPLLGLLGTVTGMIGTFGMITEHGTGDPRLLSGGISEALLTTQFGLMVAIPALVFQTTLYRIADAILRRVERFSLLVLNKKASSNEMVIVNTDDKVAVRRAL